MYLYLPTSYKKTTLEIRLKVIIKPEGPRARIKNTDMFEKNYINVSYRSYYTPTLRIRRTGNEYKFRVEIFLVKELPYGYLY